MLPIYVLALIALGAVELWRRQTVRIEALEAEDRAAGYDPKESIREVERKARQGASDAAMRAVRGDR